MTDDADSFRSITYNQRLHRCYLPLHEGKTIHQFSDRWDTSPRYAVRAADLAHKPRSAEGARYYRAACREIARSTDERTAIATVLPPGVLCGHTISVERTPDRRPNAAALSMVGVINSFPFDWILRKKAAAHVSLYILSELPFPMLTSEANRFLAHAALRLCCNHRGFASLWREQLGDDWKEVLPYSSWPVLLAQADRWRLRAAMDAVVAHAYSLDRRLYERVLGSFSHRSCLAAPDLCLAAFDALGSKGLAVFCRDHDPYHDIPLVAALAQPSIQRLLPARAGRACA